ncbi:MAG: hypothetical protein JXR07_08630 [Reichenbachiella sp.]
MIRYRCFLIFFFLTILSENVSAQYFRFSTEPDSFAVDVIRNLKSYRTEATDKVAYDFRSVWDSNLNDDQKEEIIGICESMNDRRLPTKPYFRYFFSLITYALTQENANEEDFSSILAVIGYALESYEKRELSNLFQTLTFFFARGHMYYSHYNKLSTKGGSYRIELLEELEPINTGLIDAEQELGEVDDLMSEDDEFISEDEALPIVEDSGDDSWSGGDDDGWGTDSGDDGWGTDSSDDGWGSDSSDDGWGSDSSDDGWGNDDWGGTDDGIGVLRDPEEEVKEKKYVRPIYEHEKEDLVARYQSDDIDPPLGGAVIHLDGIDFQMSSPYDTINILNASGTLLLKEQIFVGTSGQIDWPDHYKGTDGAIVHLNNYSFNTRNPEIKTSRAKMTFPEMFEDSVAGAFHFLSRRRSGKRDTKYPRFTSLYSNIEVELPGDSIKYLGGFGIVGGQKFGASISELPSVLEVWGKGERHFKSKAKKYLFYDSAITSNRAEVSIYHDEDSIYHPAVRVKYESSGPKLSLLKEKGDFKNTFYYSSFFKMEFKTDLLSWDMSSDSLDVDIMNAATMIPAVFESEEYFNPIRYEKMSGLFGFHPIMAVVLYARKVQDSHFNLLELVGAFEIEEKRLHDAVLFLNQNGYVTFDEETGDIQVLRKAFHNVMSYAKMKDYDNFLVSSISPGAPNASLNFVTKEMNVRGVKKVYITPDQEVYIEPENNVLTMLEDKGMKFNGMVNANDFQYKGHDFIFNYNEYLVQMDAIDSIRIQIAFEDGENGKRTTLDQHLEATSGTLYINDPKNKAGVKEYVQYPYFVSDSEAIVFFDKPQIRGGAYDKSIYFVVPPFKSDTVGQGDPQALGFEGTFYSGNIMPPFKETLQIMPDKSLGFVHALPEEGYNLYEGGGRLYDSLYLNNGGIQGNGRIDYRTAEVNSGQFIFYMDSVTAEGVEGLMNEGTIGEATYPEAILADFRMKWLPIKDSMYIENVKAPFQFYNSTAALEGKANITEKGVYGSGTMLSRGSKSTSQEFHFEIDKYSGRNSEFEILTDNPEKPAMAGEDIYFQFDLEQNIAEVRPETAGVAAISFPYAQMKTSITEAIWYLDSAKIEMHKPEHVDINYSYFYSTREDLDSLVFNAAGAIYDMENYELHINGIPYIRVADAEIIPPSHETTILENSVLLPFLDVDLKIDTLNGYHNLYDGYITVISRKKFEGHATYELINTEMDTFAIEFESFELKGVQNDHGGIDSMTVSGGLILESQNVKTSPGFFFKGDVTMYANRKSLHKQGYITPDIKSLGRYDYWIEYDSRHDTTDLFFDISHSLAEDRTPVVAGILSDYMTNDLYTSFIHNKKGDEDSYFFKAEGYLSYDHNDTDFKIESFEKSQDGSYKGKSFVYNDEKEMLYFEGPVSFINNKSEFAVNGTVVGVGTPAANIYELDAMLLLDMDLHPTFLSTMTEDIANVVEIIGHDVAHKNTFEVMLKLSEYAGDDVTKDYENSLLSEYMPLFKTTPLLERTMVLSNIDMLWSEKSKAWYSNSKIGLSNIVDRDINAECDGFMEIKTTEDGDDVVHFFLQVAPSTWYFFSYEHGRLMLYSSNPDFNNQVAETSTVAKTGFGEYTTVIGDEFEVLSFIDDFRMRYFGIADDYNLEFPDDQHIIIEDEEEDFAEEEEEEPVSEEEPIGDDEDDGF